MKPRLWFALAFLIASPAEAIVGPTVDAVAFADRVAMILTRGPEGSGFCTGVVLSPRVVMTAAHCLRAPANMLVHYRDENGAAVVVEVAASAINPGFRPDAASQRTRSLDIGLVETKTPLPPRFRAVALAGNPPPAPGDVTTAVGFGLSVEHTPATGGTLRAAKLAVREPRSSVLLWLEGADGAGGACAGDSGGPIFGPDGAVVAVTAWTEGASGAKCGKLTQGVLVAPLAAWISATIAGWGG
jgi:S1-C subfamily serine protease